MKGKIMYAVEHCYANAGSTYEIFETLKESKEFCSLKQNWNKEHYPTFIFKAKFNLELIYKEDSGRWNYDDFSNTILGNYKVVQRLNKFIEK